MKFNWSKYVGNMIFILDLGFLRISFFVVPHYLCCCFFSDSVFTICYNADLPIDLLFLLSFPRIGRCCPLPSRCCRIARRKSSCSACRLSKSPRPEKESGRPHSQRVNKHFQSVKSTCRKLWLLWIFQAKYVFIGHCPLYSQDTTLKRFSRWTKS